MITEFGGVSANEAWLAAAQVLEGRKSSRVQASRCGDTREILRAAISIEDPVQRWVHSRQPAMNLPFSVAEAIWILRGRRDSAFVNYFNRQLPGFAGRVKWYHGAYGFRLKEHYGIDQLERSYEALSCNSDCRQVVLQIWDPRVDMPDRTGSAVADDIPCNIVSILKIRDGKLEWTQIMRSNDFYRGLPYNIAQFTMLQEVLAGWLGVGVGGYFHYADSLHLYDKDREEFLSDEIAENLINADSLRFPKPESDRAFLELESSVEAIIHKSAGIEDLQKLVSLSELHPAHRNLLCVLAAEGIRRRKDPAKAVALMSDFCTNPVFRSMYRDWISRFSIIPIPS